MLKQIPLILVALIFTVTALAFALLPEGNRGFQGERESGQSAQSHDRLCDTPPPQPSIKRRPINTLTPELPLPRSEGNLENIEAESDNNVEAKTEREPPAAIKSRLQPAERQHLDLIRRPPWLAAYEGGSEDAGPGLTSALPAPARVSRAQDRLSFLLIGRPGDEDPLLIMVVTIFPESHARLLSIDPALIASSTNDPGGNGSHLWEISERANHYAALVRRVETISSKEISFYIELNLHGAAEMIDLLGGISPGIAGTEKIGGIEAIYLLLESPDLTRRQKERLIISILERSGSLETTRVGLALLKLGYRSIRSSLSLADLIELRRKSSKIYSTSVSYHELR